MQIGINGSYSDFTVGKYYRKDVSGNGNPVVKKTAGSSAGYLGRLQEKVSFMTLRSGEGFSCPKGNITHAITIHPKLIEKMQSNPETAKEFTQRFKDIERASKQVDSYFRSKGTVVYHNDQWYIDEKGEHHHFAQIVIKDEVNEKLRQEAQENEKRRIEKSQESARKKAEELLEELAEEQDGYAFLAADYDKGMNYGTMATTNIAISLVFLRKMAENPELRKEYESYFQGMRKLDAENIHAHEARGRRVIAQGWAIDKNGGISRWGICEPTNKRRYGQEMMDYVNKIHQERAEKKKEQEKAAEKQKKVKEEEMFKDKWKGLVFYEENLEKNKKEDNIKYNIKNNIKDNPRDNLRNNLRGNPRDNSGNVFLDVRV